MKEIIISISQILGDILRVECQEDLQSFKCELNLMLTNVPSAEELQALLPNIADRDSWRLRLLTETGDDLFDIRPKSDISVDYDSNNLEPYENDEVRMVYTIDKNKKNGTLSIYEYEVFLENLQNLYAPEFISVFSNKLDDRLVLEVWSNDVKCFSTTSMAVVKRGEPVPSLSRGEMITKRINDCKEHCQWNNKLSDLLPEDVRIIKRNKAGGQLIQLFDQMCLLLSALYVADFSSVDNNGIKLRMSGFKMMKAEIPSSKMCSLAFDTGSVEQWYKIYEWCYTGGYTSDRLTIARNIISLNSPCYEALELNASTFDTIKSNFKIFEKDNVRQYIKVRNDVSKNLLELQEKVNSIVEGFTSDFQKSVITLGTFFLTVVVVRVIAKGDIYGAFTGSITLISFAFIVLSAVNLIYSRKSLDRKEQLFIKHYGQMKKRYEPLLSSEEMNELFEDCDPNKIGSHSNYIKWIKNRYTCIWVIALVVFSVVIALLWIFNLVESTRIL